MGAIMADTSPGGCLRQGFNQGVVVVELPQNQIPATPQWATPPVGSSHNWPREALRTAHGALMRVSHRRRRPAADTEIVDQLIAERCIDRMRDDLIDVLIDELVHLGDRGSWHIDDVVLLQVHLGGFVAQDLGCIGLECLEMPIVRLTQDQHLFFIGGPQKTSSRGDALQELNSPLIGTTAGLATSPPT